MRADQSNSGNIQHDTNKQSNKSDSQLEEVTKSEKFKAAYQSAMNKTADEQTAGFQLGSGNGGTDSTDLQFMLNQQQQTSQAIQTASPGMAQQVESAARGLIARVQHVHEVQKRAIALDATQVQRTEFDIKQGAMQGARAELEHDMTGWTLLINLPEGMGEPSNEEIDALDTLFKTKGLGPLNVSIKATA